MARGGSDTIAFTNSRTVAFPGPVLAVTTVEVGGQLLVVSGGVDGTVRVWDPVTGEPVGDPWTGHTSQVSALATVEVDGRVLVVSGGKYDHTVRVWDPVTGEPVGAWIGHTDWVSALATVEVDGRVWVISGGDDHTVRVWDPVTGEPVGAPWTGHTGQVLALATVEVDGRVLVVSGGYDGTVRVWDPVTGEPVGAPWSGHTGQVWALATVEVDGRVLVISGGDDRTVRVWDPVTGEPVGAWIGHTGWVRALATVEVGGRVLVVSGGGDGTVRVWDPVTGKPVGAPWTGHTGRVLALATVEVGGRVLVVSGGYDGTVRVWDPVTGKPVGAPWTGHTGQVSALALATVEVDGRVLVVSGGDDRTVRVWDPVTGKPVGAPWTGHTGPVGVLALVTVEVGGRVLVVSGGGDGTVRVWDPVTGEPVGAPWTGHTDSVGALATVEVDGRVLVISGGEDGTVRVWDPVTGEPVGAPWTGHTDWVWALATVEVGGRVLVVSGGHDGTVRVWDPVTGEPVGAPWTGHTGPVRALATVEVGGRVLVVSGGDDHTVRVWDPVTGEPVGAPWTGHTGPVWALATVEVDGRVLVVSGGDDRTVRVWDPVTGEPVGAPWTGHTGMVLALVTVQVGNRTMVLSGSSTGISFWNEPNPVLSQALVNLPDEESLVDHLGRSVLRNYLDDLVDEFAACTDLRRGVLHLEGQWGAGKSTLISHLIAVDTPDRRVQRAQRSLSGRGTQRPRDSQPPLERKVIVHYDAWRESSIGPEWWSLGSAIHRAVSADRAIAARFWFLVTALVARVIRAKSLLITTVVIAGVAIAAGRVSGVGFEWVTTTVAAVGATVAIAIGVSQALFWAAPAFGQLHVKQDDNPLGEVAAEVMRLRRWVPRWRLGQALADTALGLWLLLSAAQGWLLFNGSLILEIHPSDTTSGHVTWHEQLLANGWALLLAVVVTMAIGHTWSQFVLPEWRPDYVDPDVEDPPANQPARSRMWWLIAGWVVSAGLGSLVVVVAHQEMNLPDFVVTHPLRTAGVLAFLGVALHIGFTWWLIKHRPTKPALLLIIDDLDRCEADRVVRLLETVHTLLREKDTVMFGPTWRATTHLIVLASADGRWLRQAFTTHYETFAALGTPTKSLGSDFLQKVFEHTVIVPQMTETQTERYLHRLTMPESGDPDTLPPRELIEPPSAPDSINPADPANPPEAPGDAPSNQLGTTPADAPPAPSPNVPPALPNRELPPTEIPSPSALSPESDRPPPAEAPSSSAVSEEAVREYAHKIARYPHLMPRNPRLIKRIVNAYGMLDTLRGYLRHDEDDNALALAAILLIRFPDLYDALVTPVRPPMNPDPYQLADNPETASAWDRDEVRQITNGRTADQFARCYGHTYPPVAPRTTSGRSSTD